MENNLRGSAHKITRFFKFINILSYVILNFISVLHASRQRDAESGEQKQRWRRTELQSSHGTPQGRPLTIVTLAGDRLNDRCCECWLALIALASTAEASGGEGGLAISRVLSSGEMYGQ